MSVETFIPPSSSHVDQVEWDSESEDCTVTYSTSGDQYMARNWTHAMWRALQQSPSTGSFLHRHFRGQRV